MYIFNDDFLMKGYVEKQNKKNKIASFWSKKIKANDCLYIKNAYLL